MMFFFPLVISAQVTNHQQVTKLCYTGLTQSFDANTGTFVGSVNFGAPGMIIPLGHKIVDVIVEIEWSKSSTAGCFPQSGIIDLSEVGFQLRGPMGGTRFLAASAATGFFAIPSATSTFAGSTEVLNKTTVFRDGYPASFPITFPALGVDTISPNNAPLSFYTGQVPYGVWRVAAIDDPTSSPVRLCVHSYCITLITCDDTQLKASCKANSTVALDAFGLHSFDFADLDSVSDVSCMVKNITFSPSSVNCSDAGVSIPVTMTIQDELNNTQSCVSVVNVVDTIRPFIVGCGFAPIWAIRYLDRNGKDTIWADSITVTDNCLPVIKRVRGFGGGPWASYVVFSCVTSYQQFQMQATDPSGNQSSCIMIVNILDTVPPQAVCGRDTAFLTTAPNGQVIVSPINLDGGSFDICPPVIGRWVGDQFAPLPVYTCADLGIDTVRLIVADASGNLDTCFNAIVVVVDRNPPTAVCQNDTVYLDISGNGMAYAMNVENGSADICGIDSVDINGLTSLPYNCSHINNPQSITFNVFDASGNTDSCSAIVIVMDTFPPLANCRSITVSLDAAGNSIIQADSLDNGSLDLCTGNYLTFEVAGNSTMSFNCAHVLTSPNIEVLTVIDSFGNASTCNAWVTVEDTINPVANCAIPTIYLNSSGVATLTAPELDAGGSDNCAIVNRYVNSIGGFFGTFGCEAIYTLQPATLIVQDASGNIHSCATTVNVEDTMSPIALCEATFTAQLNAAGDVVVMPSNLDSNSLDNCGVVEYLINGVSSVHYSCTNLGAQNATLTVRDSSGNMDACITQVIIQDNIAPVVSCQTATVYLNLSGVAIAVPNDVLIFPATSDNCNIAFIGFLGGASVTYTCDSVGPRSVTVIVVDDYGNASTCITTITVLDTIAPSANCRATPFTLQLDPSGNGCITPFDINNGSTDLCDLDTMFVNGVDSFCFNCSDMGVNLVTLSVLDSSGNQSTCLASVIIDDVLNPVASCHDTTVYLNPSGLVTVWPANIDASSSDNCSFGLAINGASTISYNCTQVGTNPVQLTVTDISGNVDQCSANITVLDSIHPVAACIAPGVFNVFLDSSCFATVPAYTLNNGSTDNCNLTIGSYNVAGLPNFTFTAANLLTNPNSVTLTVIDPSGNLSTCNTTVNVVDVINPTVNCRPDTVQLDVLGNAVVTPAMINAGSNDNCSPLSFTVDYQPFVTLTCAELGMNTLIFTAIDSSGNSSSCTAGVLIEDLIAPIASCNPTTVVSLVSGGTYGLLTTGMIDLGSSDNCAITTYATSQDTFTCSDLFSNPHAVTLVVSDNNGNVDSCTSQITVQDITTPTATCQTNSVYLGGGIVTVTPALVLVTPPTGDNCVPITSSFFGIGSNLIYNCDSIGIHAVTVIVTDISGNTASCVTTITVLDTTVPVASCSSVPFTVQLDTSGNGCITPFDIDNGSFDFCGIDTMLVNGVDSLCYNCLSIGNSAVTLSVLDESGNQGVCIANITVNDPINPIALCHDTTLYLSTSGIVTLVPADIDAGSYDNCAFTSTINGLPSINYNCGRVGTNTSQLMITDISGNTTQCASNVTVLDTILPTANCIAPGLLNVYLDNTCFASIPATALNNGSTDNCSASLSFSVGGLPNVTFNALNVGNNPNPITLVVRDATGNVSTCNTTIIVIDSFPPIILCQPDTIQLTGSNTVVTPSMLNNGSTDNCSVPSLTINGQLTALFDCSNLGSNTVTLIGTDISGNVDSCITTVYLEDVTNPAALCNLATTAIIDPSNNLAILDPVFVDNVSTDNCNIVTYILSKDTFDCLDIANNTHVVTLVVIDESGNRDSCVTQVTIQDTISPVAVCVPIDTLFFVGATISITPALLDAGSFDNCGIESFVLSQGNFNCPDLGLNMITLTVTDSSGNIGTCTAPITVLDTTASAFAGAAQLLCGIDSTIFAANPATGILLGTWTSTSTASIGDINAPMAMLSNIPPGISVFYWTLSNATCSNLSQDSVVINHILNSPDVAEAGLDQNLCDDSTTMLTASPISISTGFWLQSAAQTSAGVIIASPTDSSTIIAGLIPGNSYTFMRQLTNGLCGVHMIDTVLINIDDTPMDSAMAGANEICSPATINLSATPPLFGVGQWSTPSSVVVTTPSSATSTASNFQQDTTYMIWSLTNGVCIDYSIDTMLVILDAQWPIAIPDLFSLIPDGTSSTIDVILNDNLPASWIITVVDSMDTGQMIGLGNGQYEVDINNSNINQYLVYKVCNSVCPDFVCDTALVTIAIQPPGDCYTPNAFTPNQDGYNDLFIIPCIDNVTEKAALYIFNRWGNVVYETDSYQNDWDGSHKNNPLPDGVYFYILQIENKTPQQGSIEIKR
jgi:gliding motility-associated-like protein